MLEPFEGYIVDPAHAPAVITAPFDALTFRQRQQRAEHPDSFLRVLPPGEGDELTERLTEARRRLDEMIAAGRFRALAGPTLAILRLTSGPHQLTGVIGDLPASAFDDGAVRPHEQVGQERVETLSRYLEAVRMASSPVCISHLPDPEVTAMLERFRRRDPAIDLTDPAGRVTVWLLDDPGEQSALSSALGRTREWLLADGHHRAAAGSCVDRVLAVLVSDDSLHIRPFHRRLSLEEPERAGGLLRSRGLEVDDLPGPTPPLRPGEVSVAGGDRWWRVTLPSGDDTPVGRLDVTRAGQHVLGPLLGSSGDFPDSVLADRRVEAVAPTVPLAGLPTRRTVGVALHPPTMAQIREVVATGQTLPPKTTYVVPKQRSGLFVVPR